MLSLAEYKEQGVTEYEAESLAEARKQTQLLAEILASVGKMAPQTILDVQKPRAIQTLIDSGYIRADGKTAIYSLADIAKKIKELINADFIKSAHLECFIKPDGKKYSPSAIKKAVELANAG
jgi:hypothetical protein